MPPIEQNLAVNFYEDLASNPRGLPDQWPAEVMELGADTKLPAGFQHLFTTSTLLAHIALHQSEYDAWEALNLVDPVEAIRLSKKAVLQEILA